MTRNLREQRASVWAQMQEIRDAVDKDGWTSELRTSWDAADNDFRQLTADIERTEAGAELDRRFSEIDDQTRHVDGEGRQRAGSADEYRNAFRSYLRFGLQDMPGEERSVLQANFRAQSAGTGSTGGYTVPEGFWAKVTETLKYFGGVEAAGAEVIRTETGAPLPWATNDDTGNVGAILAENTELSTVTDLTFGQKTLGAFQYTSNFIKASMQFLQDSAIDPEAFIARKAGERIGRILNTHFTVGTATTQPQGLVVGASAGRTALASATVAFDDLILLQHSVDVAYRGMPNAGWMMNDSVAGSVRRLKTTDGQYLWQPSLVAGQPDGLLGRPVTINNDMAAIGSAAKTVAFGDFRSAYVIRYVNGASLMRLTERFADYLQVAFLAHVRADGLVQDSAAVKYLVQS